MRDQAVFSYRGTDMRSGGPVYFSDVVQQSAVSGGVSESSTNSFNGGPSAPVTVLLDAGAIVQPTPMQFSANGALETIRLTELRSPIRVNDLYIHADRHIADYGQDLDGDKVNEAMDVAMYSQVMGAEVIDLPSRAQVSTVRVDTKLRARIQYSKDKSYSPIVESTLSAWYAPGLGLVKAHTVAIDATSPSLYQEEVLVSWDGIDRGMGAMAIAAPVAPANSNIAGNALPIPADVVAFADHAVVLSNIPMQSAATGFALSHIDTRGQVVASTAYSYSSLLNLGEGYELRLARNGNEVAVLMRTAQGLAMLRFDTNGQTLLSPTPALLIPGSSYTNYDAQSFAVQSTSSGLWVANLTYPDSITQKSDLQLRKFDSTGLPASPLQTITSIKPQAMHGLRLAESAGQLLVSWTTDPNLPQSWRYMSFASSDGTAGVSSPLNVTCSPFFTPYVFSSGVKFLCPYPNLIGEVSLDAGFLPVLSNGSPLVRPITPSWWATGTAPQLVSATGDLLTVAVTQPATTWPLWPSSNYLEIAELPLLGGAFSATQAQLLGRLTPADIYPLYLLTMGNRVLVLGTNCWCQGGTLRTTVAWRTGA